MESNHPLVYVLLLNWNGKDLTVECVESLQKSDYPNYKILIVDNGSVDDSVKIFRERFQYIMKKPIKLIDNLKKQRIIIPA